MTEQTMGRDAWIPLLEELVERDSNALQMGGVEKLARRHVAGEGDARGRIDSLIDPGSFQEWGRLAVSAADPDTTPADGKVSGFARIDGRRVAIVSNDMTVKGASSAPTNMKKIARIKESATKVGMPLIFLGESSGSRVPDSLGAAAMSAAGMDPQQYCRRREIPWVSAVLGPCLGSSTWYSCLADFVVMKKGAFLAVSSARVTSLAIGEAVDSEELGGWRLRAETTGLVDKVVASEDEAMAAIRQFLSYLPSHAGELPPELPQEQIVAPDGETLLDIVPVARQKTYDIRKAIKAIVDEDSFFPLKERFGKSVVTALARLNGKSVGVIATNPMYKGGAMDPDACRKAASMIVLCDSFNIPLVFLVDTPGFLVGIEGERKAAPAQIMNMLHALQLSSVASVTVIMRKSYGQAYINLGGGRNSDSVAAWPTADVSFMDPHIGVSVITGLKRDDDPERFDQLKQDLVRDTSAFALAGAYGAQTVIRPQDTRQYLIDMLEMQKRPGLGDHELRAWPTYI